MKDRLPVPAAANSYRDPHQFSFINDLLQGDLRQLYWQSVGKNELADPVPEPVTFEYLVSLPGRKRAALLRANKGLREEYLRRTSA